MISKLSAYYLDKMSRYIKGSQEPLLATLNMTRAEASAIAGEYYAASSERLGVATGNLYYTVLQTGSKQVTLEDLVVILNFSDVSDGQFDYEIRAYVDSSNKNDWSFTGGFTGSLGSPLNTALINNVSDALITADANVTLTGSSDYFIYAASDYVDTSANRDIISETKNSFFTNDRKLIIPPNTSVLFESRTGGTATGTVDITSQIFTIERA